ncbi:MAG: hypothetical protein PUC63_03570 [Clostridiales bacterium]|nr:hypothetical protein [Clostridiales bacterium]
MKRLQIMLLILLLMTMTACGNMPEMSSDSKAEISQEEITASIPVESQTKESSSQEASAETNTDTTDPVQTKPETEETSNKEAATDKPKQNKTSSSQAVNDPSPDEINEKGSGTPEPEEEKPQEQPQAEESKPLPEPPAETKPEESKTPEPEPEKTTEPEPAPKFDIDYWIGYAQSIATSKGLVLESSAVDCWDNPITANPDCIYLERDISGYLSRYAADEDITDVWIWYECIGENKYLIYIGYA